MLTFIVLPYWSIMPQTLGGERGGSVVECRTPEREVRGSRPTAAVLCPWARHFTPRKYWLITQEAMAPSRHDWKIVDWDVKPQHNQPTRHLTWYHTQSHYLDTGSTSPNSSAKRGAAGTIFKDFGMSRPGLEPATSRSRSRRSFNWATELLIILIHLNSGFGRKRHLKYPGIPLMTLLFDNPESSKRD